MSRIPGAAARRLVLPALLAVLGHLAAGSARAQVEPPTSPRPDWRTCDPDLESALSAAPTFSVPLDLTHGLVVGRSSRTPFTASARAAAMVSVLPRTHRLLAGPVAGVALTNPKVEGLLGARLAYRIWALGLHQGLDLGTRADLVAEGGWETEGGGVAALGLVVDLSVLRLVGRGTLDFARDEGRIELGLGRTLYARRREPPPTVPPDAGRWQDAQFEFLAVARTGVARAFGEPAPVDTTLLPWERPEAESGAAPVLCDGEALRRLSRRAAELERTGHTLDDIVRGARADSLLRLTARLEAPPRHWRQLALQAAAAPPAAGEREAVRALALALRRMLLLEYGVR